METPQYLCSDQHILLLKESITKNDQIMMMTCERCKYSVTSPYYACDSCKYYIHKSCAELPQQINHSFHPRHPLTLIRGLSRLCDSCFRDISVTDPRFNCSVCDFDLDVECALMSNSIGQSGIQHSSHPHVLQLVDKTDEIHKYVNVVRCYACQGGSSPSSHGEIYGCIRCEYFLHKQCIDQFPQQIQTLFHPNHDPLSLHLKRFHSKCHVCRNTNRPALYYECSQCDFQLCLECHVKSPLTISYEHHPHLLCFVDNMTITFDHCDVYDTCLKQLVKSNCQEFHTIDSSLFGCLDCDFKLHLLCGPLPSMIKHQDHMHCLDLVDSFIDDTSGEYCCDICEKERNPRIRIYYCSQCKFTAHVHCVISEIINVLKGDLKDVKLKELGEDLWKLDREIDYSGVKEKEHKAYPLTLKDLIHKLSDDQLCWLKYGFYWDEDYDGEDEEEGSELTAQLELLRFSSFTENEFVSFIFEEFDSTYYERKLKIKSRDLALKIVEIKDHFIPINLVSAMKSLLNKYGDISPNYSDVDSQNFKSICFYFICKVMKEIHTTLAIDITKNLLQQWYHYIKFAEYWADFKVGFLWNSLEKITRHFYYQQLRKLVDIDIPTVLEERILGLRLKIDEYKEFRESLSKEESMKKGLEEAMKFKWSLANEIGF